MFGSFLAAFRGARFAGIAPDTPLAVIGDVHGRFDLLEQLVHRIGSNRRLVCVGDYIDRGDRSAEVLTFLHSRSDIICLRGNHEDMLLDFLRTPEDTGGRWLRFGGLQTLASFGIGGLGEASRGTELLEARDCLRAAMGTALIDWLEQMPVRHVSGNVVVVHAGADPTCPIDDQPASGLLWGHPEFFRTPRRDGLWVAHGHTIVATPSARAGRIALDTGAYATGRLTAALIDPEGVTFVST